MSETGDAQPHMASQEANVKTTEADAVQQVVIVTRCVEE